MSLSEPILDLNTRLRGFISQYATQPSPDEPFNQLALDLFAFQFANVAAYRALCRAKGIEPGKISHWRDIPAVPTTAFKDFELTSLPTSERTSVFHSSGTTEQRPSRHFHSAETLSIYEASLLPWFKHHFLADLDDLLESDTVNATDKFGYIILTPPPESVPHSSLVHMFDCIRRELGSRDSFFGGRMGADGAWTLDLDQVLFGIRKSMCANRPIAILGTAFSFVHLLDHFADKNMRYKLAEGSRVLETGGYKGRSRVLPKRELHQLITKHLGIPTQRIGCEYGMSELSSQAYDLTMGQSATEPRAFHFPSWARVEIISPETGREVAEGETGLIRIFDLANVRSVLAVQTEDLGVKRGNGFELIGRATASEPRGCSLMST
jgi:hypothetical protein